MNRTDLLNALRSIAGIVPSRAERPAIGCVLHEDGKLHVTNLEQHAIVTIGGDLPTFCVNAKRFLAVLSEIDDEEVTITPHKNGITVKGGSASFQLPCVDPAEFPRDNRLHTIHAVGEYETAELAAAIRFCATARADEESRLAMHNIALGGGFCAATDGRRLHVYEIASDDEEVLLPPKFADFIAKSDADTASLTAFGSGYTAALGETRIVTRKLGSGFPDWKRVYPAPYSTYVTLDAESLVSAMSRAKLVTEDAKYPVTLAYQDDVLLVTVQALDVEVFRETIPCEGTFSGDVRVNPQYVIDGVIPIGKATVHVTDGAAPVILRSFDGKANAVIMPIRA
jgi:DNA polymerase III subunit beta